VICAISFRFVSFRFVSFRFVSFRFVSFRFVSFRFVSFRFVSFRLFRPPAPLSISARPAPADPNLRVRGEAQHPFVARLPIRDTWGRVRAIKCA
jgi:hypothetical protein